MRVTVGSLDCLNSKLTDDPQGLSSGGSVSITRSISDLISENAAKLVIIEERVVSGGYAYCSQLRRVFSPSMPDELCLIFPSAPIRTSLGTPLTA